MLVALLTATPILTLLDSTAKAAGEKITMGMPFTGKWAYNALAPYSTPCSTTAHPSCHTTKPNGDMVGYHWAIDYYANDGTGVVLNGTSGQGTVSYSTVEGSGTCGESLIVTAKVGTVTVGQIYVTHLVNAAAGVNITNGGSAGDVYNGGQPYNNNGCFNVDHVHFSYKNTVANKACYINHSTQQHRAGMELASGTDVGILGSGNTGIQEICGSGSGGGGGSGPNRPIPGDFDANGYTNSAVFRPSTGYWHVRGDLGGGTGGDYQYGQAGDIPVPADYNGDGRTEIAVFRPSTGYWHVRGNAGFAGGDYGYGQAGDIPVPGDYNGNGQANIAVYRPSTGYWHVRGDLNGAAGGDYLHGQAGDIPVPGYYNSDAIQDIAVYRPSDGGWRVRAIGDWPHGWATDIPVQGDYNGDGITDSAVYRPSDGGWRVRAVGDWPHGISTDIPVPGRFNSDNSWDSAVYRPSDGGWRVRGVGDWPYGQSTDIPAIQTLNAYLLLHYGLISTY